MLPGVWQLPNRDESDCDLLKLTSNDYRAKPNARHKMNECVFDRITMNQNQMGGVPCIRGLRIPVATVVGMVANGMNTDEILNALSGSST